MKKDIYKIFGNNVRKYREEKELTLKELSFLSKINIKYLIKIEKGEAKRITTRHIFTLAIALKIQPYKLVIGL